MSKGDVYTAIILLLHVFQTIVHPQFLMSLLEMMENGVLVFWVVIFFSLFQWIFQSISISVLMLHYPHVLFR
jgi:hypothetical protein